jgi:tetratricopeptide (TPR) repeat protein
LFACAAALAPARAAGQCAMAPTLGEAPEEPRPPVAQGELERRRARAIGLERDDPARLAALLDLASAQRAAGTTDELRTLALIVQDHPAAPMMDAVLHRLALGLSRLGQHEHARQTWLRLIQGYPESRFVPAAYVAFGDFYARQDVEAAVQFYDRAIERGGGYLAYARYRRAWALAARGDRSALQELAAATSALERSGQIGADAVRAAIARDRPTLAACLR